MKKLMLIGLVSVLLLSIFANIYPVEICNASGNTFYVGGVGPGNYTTIQSAIDAASSGDTVFVCNGIYQEDLTMNYKNNVKLIGESMDNVILEKLNYNAFVVLGCTDVTIKNFNFSGWYFAIYNGNVRVKVSNLYVNPHGLILGIEMFYGSQDCEIYNCYVTNSTYGIWVPWNQGQGHQDSTNTHIHHNNMIGNTYSAIDDSGGSSIWEYNYYDDYTGTDANGDGIGDTPYDIGITYLGSVGNQDLYPFMQPNGWLNEQPVANFTFTPQNPTNTTIIHFIDTSTDSDGTIVSWWWNFGDDTTSTAQNPTHTYTTYGTYFVTLTVTDNEGSSDSKTKSITVSQPPSSITVSSPNGGETWYKGDTYTVTWTSENTGDYVKIELYKKSASYSSSDSYVSTIASSTSNDGSYSWVIPNNLVSESSYKIKIIPLLDDSISGDSGYFAIENIPFIAVSSINENEIWYRGDTYTITWDSDNVGNYVKIELYKNDSYVMTIASDEYASYYQYYQWAIPDTLEPSSDYKIKITSMSDSSVCDYCDGYLTIKETWLQKWQWAIVITAIIMIIFIFIIIITRAKNKEKKRVFEKEKKEIINIINKATNEKKKVKQNSERKERKSPRIKKMVKDRIAKDEK
jgi:PKD repeat protein